MAWENVEVRFGVVGMAVVVVWCSAMGLFAVAVVMQMWRLGVAAVLVAVLAGALTVIRDNCKTRRVVRSLVRDLREERFSVVR